jgi:hypothetical protein
MSEQKPASTIDPPDDLNAEINPLPEIEDDEKVPGHTHVKHANFDVHKKTKSRRSRRRKKLFLALLLIIACGGTYLYLNVFNKETKQTVVAPASSPSNESQPAETRLFFQLANKVISYDTDSKKIEQITDKLPETAGVIDIYSDQDSWRLYAENYVEAEGVTQIIYMDSNTDPKVLSTETEISFAVANAEHNIVAYSQYPNIEGTPPLPTRTIVIGKDNRKSTVYTSGLLAEDSAKLGLKDPLYSVTDISSDGKRLLYNRANCIFCDGGATATSFELDLATNRATQVYISKKKQGDIKYYEDGYLVRETDHSALGMIEGNYIESYLMLDKIGSPPKSIFQANEKNWAYIDFDKNHNLIYVENRAVDYRQTGKTSFGGLYELAGAQAKQLKALKISSGVDTKTESISLGSKIDECYSARLMTRDTSQPKSVLKVGVLCKSSESAYNFQLLGSITNDSATNTFKYAEPLE